MSGSQATVSIVCVFNDRAVLQACLSQSIQTQRHEVPEVEYLPIDNTQGQFASAGAALNHGASLAHNEYVAFVHQDVYLHSLTALPAAAASMANDESIGMLGAVGISSDGRILGRIRDRVVLLGERLSSPSDVDSLDEVLFMVSRQLILAEPLAATADLAWHAYAVEYGLRLRSRGLRVTAGDIPLTHNSLTTNLARLDVAHRTVGDMYPEQLPVRTTCGIITGPRRPRPGEAMLRPHRWRYAWLKESVVAHQASRRGDRVPFVLSDIRLDIDQVLAHCQDPLQIINLADVEFAGDSTGPLPFARYEHTVAMSSVPRSDLSRAVAARGSGGSMLVTNLSPDDARVVASLTQNEHRVFGFHGGLGCWALLGPAAKGAVAQWNTARCRPFAMGTRAKVRRMTFQ